MTLIEALVVEEFSVDHQKPYGDYLFGQERNLPESPLSPEKNTQKEAELYVDIKNHIIKNISKFSTEELETMQSLLRSNEYSDVLTKPKQRYVFRGLFFDRKSPYEKFIDELESSGNIYTQKIKVAWHGHGNSPASSWTTSLNSAKLFSGKSLPIGPDKEIDYYSVIMIADIRENEGMFLDFSGWYNNVNKTMSAEKEILALGPIKVKKIIHGPIKKKKA